MLIAQTDTLPISQAKPWLKYFATADRETVVPAQTIYASLKNVCREYPKAKALYYYGRSVTYRELFERIDKLADAFYALGVRKGNMVSFLTPTMPESICSMYAVNKIGGISNFIDPRMDVERILDAANGTDSDYLVAVNVSFDKVTAILDRLQAKKIVVACVDQELPPLLKPLFRAKMKSAKISCDGERIISWKQFLAGGKNVSAPEAAYRENTPAVITYTGGTTGTPKGVLLSDDGLNTMAHSLVCAGPECHQAGDRFLAIMPIFASYGVGCGVHMPLSQAWELVIIPKFVPEELGKLIRKYKPNHMMAVPSFYERVMHSRDLWDVDLSFLKTTGCGGETMNLGLEKRFNAFLKEHGGKYPLSQGYGMSEMSGAATCCFFNVYKDESAGIPLLATTIGIFDPETGKELGYGEQGEICMTGRNMMLSYYNNEEETENVMRRHDDGQMWIHSGDIGYIDEDGFLFIKGRIKQIIIKFDGHKVFPVSIESILNRQKVVAECAVIGIADPDHAQGEVPLGIVRLKETPDDPEALRKELMDYCFKTCEERGRPADILFADSIPITSMGKHDYKKLKEQYGAHQIR